MEKDLAITGKIISGAGEGAYFTQIGWVQQQCDEKLGFGVKYYQYQEKEAGRIYRASLSNLCLKITLNCCSRTEGCTCTKSKRRMSTDLKFIFLALICRQQGLLY